MVTPYPYSNVALGKTEEEIANILEELQPVIQMNVLNKHLNTKKSYEGWFYKKPFILALLAHVGPRTICSNSWSRL
jgi:hypothetical protein